MQTVSFGHDATEPSHEHATRSLHDREGFDIIIRLRFQFLSPLLKGILNKSLKSIRISFNFEIKFIGIKNICISLDEN